MKKIGLGILIILIALTISGVAGAGMLIPTAEQAKKRSKIDNSSVIEIDADDNLALTTPGLEKIVFIHYKKGYGGFCNNNGVCERELGENPSCADCKKDKDEPEEPTTACYAFLGKSTKWKGFPVD